MMKTHSVFVNVGLLGIISLIFYRFNIRICPFYNLFKIPCPGCGLTTSFVYLLKLDWQNSLKANVLGLPIFIIFLIYFVFCLAKKENVFHEFLKKNQKTIIIVSVFMLIVAYYINLNY